MTADSYICDLMINRNVTEDIISIIKETDEKNIAKDEQHTVILIPFALKALRRLLRRDEKSRYQLAYHYEMYRTILRCKLVSVASNFKYETCLTFICLSQVL